MMNIDDDRRSRSPPERRTSRRCRAPASACATRPPRFEDAGDQDRDRRIERQHVMRQLGDHHFEHHPGRHQPGQQEVRARLAPRLPDRAARPGPASTAPGQNVTQNSSEVIARRRAMRFLTADHLGQHVLADRLREEAAAGLGDDRDEPGQHQQRAARRSRRPAAATRASAPSGRRSTASSAASPTNIRISGPLSSTPPRAPSRRSPAAASRRRRPACAGSSDRCAPSRPSPRRR